MWADGMLQARCDGKAQLRIVEEGAILLDLRALKSQHRENVVKCGERRIEHTEHTQYCSTPPKFRTVSHTFVLISQCQCSIG